MKKPPKKPLPKKLPISGNSEETTIFTRTTPVKTNFNRYCCWSIHCCHTQPSTSTYTQITSVLSTSIHSNGACTPIFTRTTPIEFLETVTVAETPVVYTQTSISTYYEINSDCPPEIVTSTNVVTSTTEVVSEITLEGTTYSTTETEYYYSTEVITTCEECLHSEVFEQSSSSVAEVSTCDFPEVFITTTIPSTSEFIYSTTSDGEVVEATSTLTSYETQTFTHCPSEETSEVIESKTLVTSVETTTFVTDSIVTTTFKDSTTKYTTRITSIETIVLSSCSEEPYYPVTIPHESPIYLSEGVSNSSTSVSEPTTASSSASKGSTSLAAEATSSITSNSSSLTSVASTSVSSSPVSTTPVNSTSVSSTSFASSPVASSPVVSSPVVSSPVSNTSVASTSVTSVTSEQQVPTTASSSIKESSVPVPKTIPPAEPQEETPSSTESSTTTITSYSTITLSTSTFTGTSSPGTEGVETYPADSTSTTSIPPPPVPIYEGDAHELSTGYSWIMVCCLVTCSFRYNSLHLIFHIFLFA